MSSSQPQSRVSAVLGLEPVPVPHEQPTPTVGCFTKLWVGYPRCVMLLTFLIINGVGYFGATSLFNPDGGFKEPVNTGWSINSHPHIQRIDAWSKIRDVDNHRRALSHKGRSSRWKVKDQITIMYQSATSVLTEGQVAKMIAIESALLDNTPDFEELHCQSPALNGVDLCRSPNSVLKYLFENASEHEQQCKAGYCSTASWSVLCGDSATPWGVLPCFSFVFDWRKAQLSPSATWATKLNQALAFDDLYASPSESLRILLSETKNGSVATVDLSSTVVRSQYNLHKQGLYDDAFTRQVQKALNQARGQVSGVNFLFPWLTPRDTPELSGDEMNVFFSNWNPTSLLPNIYLDMIYALISLSFIFVYIWFNVSSVLLALAALFEILMSIPLALFLWKVVLRQSNIDFLQLVMVFIIMCIGADDVFVYMDVWRASATMPQNISGSLHTRFAWTWKKAAATMFATTLTTCVCLGLTATSTIPTVRSFGLFGSFLVLVDYIQVITWFPAVVVWYEKHMTCCTKKKKEKRKEKEQSSGKEPAEEEGEESGPGPAKPPRVARILRDVFSPWLYKVRYFSVALAVALGVAGIAVRATLFEPVESIPLFKPSHPWEMRATLSSESFYSAASGGDDRVYAGLVYGLAPTPIEYATSWQILPDGLEPDDVQLEKTLKYDDTFELTPAKQEELVATCEAAAANPALVAPDGSGSAFCLLNALKAANSTSFPYPTELALRTAIDTHYGSFGLNGRSGYVAGETYPEIKAIYNSFLTTLSKREVVGSSIFGGDPRITNPVVQGWNDFATSSCSSDDDCFATIYGEAAAAVGFGALLGGLSEFANQTIIICVIACFFVLVGVTLNVIVALFATMTVGLVIGGVMGLIIAAGMKDGMYENVFTILVVGMSIDYAVHLAHFYINAPGTRYDKARSAMYEVGASVIGGAITTIGAGIPLFLCVCMFFFTQGLFIFLTALSALFFSFFFLVPLLMIAGPERSQGDLSVLYRGLRSARIGHVNKKEGEVTSQTV